MARYSAASYVSLFVSTFMVACARASASNGTGFLQVDAMQRLAAAGAEKEKVAAGSTVAALAETPPAKGGAVIAPFGKEDTATELQKHAARTQDTLVDAVENAEVAEIKRAVFRALTRLRAATIKEFDTIARLETQAIDAYNDAHHYRAEIGRASCRERV